MERTLLQRIHNPRNRICGCDPDCWCRRTAVGRAIKWWFPAWRFGIEHKADDFRGMTEDELREWKREQQDRGGLQMSARPGYEAQPKYEKIVRLAPRRWGITVRLPDGRLAVHEILGRPRLDNS